MSDDLPQPPNTPQSHDRTTTAEEARPTVDWGGQPMAQGEEPYPQDHKYHQMTVAEAPAPTASGPLGGLWSREGRLWPLSQRYALGLFAFLMGNGLMMAAAPMTGLGVSPNHPLLAHRLTPFITLLLLSTAHWALKWPTSTGLAAPLDGLKRRWPHHAIHLLTLCISAAWLLLGLMGASGLLEITRWIALIAALCNLGALAHHFSQSPSPPLWKSKWQPAHFMAQALILGAGLLGILAFLMDLELAERTLQFRLLTLGLVTHAIFCQRLVQGDGEGSHQLRVGRYCIAYRWILWVGILLPLTLVAISLTTTLGQEPARFMASLLTGLFILPWLWLWLRAGQSNFIPSPHKT